MPTGFLAGLELSFLGVLFYIHTCASFFYGVIDYHLLYFLAVFVIEKGLDYYCLKRRQQPLLVFLKQALAKFLFYSVLLMIANGLDYYLTTQLVAASLLFALFVQEALQVLAIAALAGFSKEASVLQALFEKFSTKESVIGRHSAQKVKPRKDESTHE